MIFVVSSYMVLKIQQIQRGLYSETDKMQSDAENRIFMNENYNLFYLLPYLRNTVINIYE